MTQEISSLMDGELSSPEAERAIRACCTTPEAAQKWQEYHLIGDVLRGGLPHPTDTAARVARALQSEPAIIARPKRVLETTVGRVALAAAASVATIGVVGWIGTQGGQVPGGSHTQTVGTWARCWLVRSGQTFTVPALTSGSRAGSSGFGNAGVAAARAKAATSRRKRRDMVRPPMQWLS